MRNTLHDDFIDKLRAGCDIVAVISEYVPLQRKGKNYWGCCPFHQEKTPSFSVAQDKGFFYCFGCQAGGNVFNFLMRVENIPFMDAVKLLARKLNIPLPEREKSLRDRQEETEIASMYRINQLAKDYYHACLTKTSYGKQAREYLLSRGIKEEIIEQFQLGFALPVWDKLYCSLLERGVQGDSIVKAGLAIPRSGQDGAYDRFRNRVMYPIFDVHGQVIGFGGRVLDQSQPKYLNSPETIIFNKRNILYGLNFASKHIKELDHVIIVEGYMDLIACHAAGIKNVVASLGTAFTQEQARQILRFTKDFVFAYDNDAAGQNATLRALSMVRAMGVAVRVVLLTEGKDPDECIRNHGAEWFQSLVKEAPALLDYQIRRAMESEDMSTLEGKVAIVAKAVPALAMSDNAVEIASYVAQLAQKLAIDESAIRSELTKHIRMNKKGKTVRNGHNINASMLSNQSNMATIMAERHIIRIMCEVGELIPDVCSQILPEDIQDQYRWEIMNSIFLAYNMEKTISPTMVSTTLSDAACAELSSIMVMETDYQDAARMLTDCIKTIRLSRLNTLYEKHRLQADEFERMGDSRFLQELAESQRIKDEINKLYY